VMRADGEFAWLVAVNSGSMTCTGAPSSGPRARGGRGTAPRIGERFVAAIRRTARSSHAAPTPNRKKPSLASGAVGFSLLCRSGKTAPKWCSTSSTAPPLKLQSKLDKDHLAQILAALPDDAKERARARGRT